MRGRRRRGGTSAPPGPGARPASLGSTSSVDTTLEEERLRNVQNETKEETGARRRAEAGEGTSSSALPSPSRFLQGARQAAKKVLGVDHEGVAADAQEETPFAEMEQAITGLINVSHEKTLINIDDVVVRKETATGILSLCTDEEANSSAIDYDVPDLLQDRFMVTNKPMTGLMDPSHKKVEPKRLPREVATKWPLSNSLNQSYQQWCISQKHNCRPNEIAVKWSLDDDDGISYPLYAEFCGETVSSSQRREWTDVRLARKLRGLRQEERLASRNHFKMLLSWPATRRKPRSLFMVAIDKLNNEKQKEEHSGSCEVPVPEYLLCPLSGELMVDPVTIATGKTFERSVLKDWFKKNGQICPVTHELVSGTILRSDRVKRYLKEWAEAKFELTTKFKDGRK